TPFPLILDRVHDPGVLESITLARSFGFLCICIDGSLVDSAQINQQGPYCSRFTIIYVAYNHNVKVWLFASAHRATTLHGLYVYFGLNYCDFLYSSWPVFCTATYSRRPDIPIIIEKFIARVLNQRQRVSKYASYNQRH